MEVDSALATTTPSPGAVPVRSCTTCAKAKAKCVRNPGRDICDRCLRLNKECSSKEPVLKKKKIVKTSRAAQLEKLESKIEHLVFALSNGSQVVPPQHGHPSPATSQASADKALNRSAGAIGVPCQDPINSPQEEGPPSPITPVTVPADSLFGGIAVPEAEVLVGRYRRLMSSSMPFVVLTNKASTIQTMQDSRPVLLHAILTVAYFHDLPKQQLLVKELIREIADRILSRNEKTLDILQGILVFVAWYHIHIFWSQQVTNLLHLAMSVSVDMSMNRPPHHTLQDFRKATALPHAPTLGIRTLSLDDHRALVGIFYLSSMLAASFRKIHAMPYTKYMDESLRNLEQAREYESDLLLVQLVRVQRVIEQIHTTDTPNAPIQMYIKAFQGDITQLRKANPCKDDNLLLNMEYVMAEIFMWELSLNDLQERKTRPLVHYLDDLYHCLEAIKVFLDLYFTVPAAAYVVMPFSVFAWYAHVFIVLIKLCVLEVEGWDLKALGQQINLSHVIDESNRRFEDASRAAPEGIPINNDSFRKITQRLRWMKTVYEAKFGPAEGSVTPDLASARAAAAAAGPGPPTAGAAASSAASANAGNPAPEQQQQQHVCAPGDELGHSADFFNYVDENFWNSFVADFDLGFPDPTALTSTVA